MNNYQLVLICSDRSKHSLGEDEGADAVRGQLKVTQSHRRVWRHRLWSLQRLSNVVTEMRMTMTKLLLMLTGHQSNEVDARLVLAHWCQHNLITSRSSV